jgi:hypothetical protein
LRSFGIKSKIDPKAKTALPSQSFVTAPTNYPNLWPELRRGDQGTFTCVLVTDSPEIALVSL